MERTPGHIHGGMAPSLVEPGGDLLGGLVGEGDRQDPPGRDVVPVDEALDPADETMGLAGTGAGDDQNRAQRRFDGPELLRGEFKAHARTGRTTSARDHCSIVSVSSVSTSAGER